MLSAVVLWNEPNNLSHWDRDLDPDWAYFGEMVRLAGERLARVAPGLPRVLGGISPIDPWFVRTLFDHGVGDAVDVLAVHGFPLDWNRWNVEEWPARVESIRERSGGGKPIWATEVGVSSLVDEGLQAWGLDRTLELLAPAVERVYWYALMDLPHAWEAVTRHRGSEGSAYFRHFRMGVFDEHGRPKPAAERLAAWAARPDVEVGVCEWVYWREYERLDRMVRLLRELGIKQVRTGIGWADWDRDEAPLEWFDHVMRQLEDFEVAATLCFTPARAGRRPHHTSPPIHLGDFADFCEAVVRRYALVPAQ